MNINDICLKLYSEKDATDKELLYIIETNENPELLFTLADKRRKEIYGTDVYIRGLIEISSYCRNNCLYCGIRKSNSNACRYRLGKEEILDCCRAVYEMGFRTFVMQGGEDPYYTDGIVCDIVSSIKSEMPDCAVTLSLGERSEESYRLMRESGADRYLLRHETADEDHYASLHPAEMLLANRKKCLFDLKKLGYQVGSGFMVGSPGQRGEHLVKDIRFLQKLSPDMIGIGPFISHKDTPFKDEPNGTLELTVKLVAILRLMFPEALIPATTALASIGEGGREMALRAGANVVMPNLSPENVRSMYSLYDNKAHSGAEAAESLRILKETVNKCGYNVVVHRGDVRKSL